jgi:hypothetical protein
MTTVPNGVAPDVTTTAAGDLRLTAGPNGAEPLIGEMLDSLG